MKKNSLIEKALKIIVSISLFVISILGINLITSPKTIDAKTERIAPAEVIVTKQFVNLHNYSSID